MNKEDDLKNLEALHFGAEYAVNWSEGGGGLVYRMNDVYILFEVPQFGGMPRYEGTYFKKTLPDLLDEAYSWT